MDLLLKQKKKIQIFFATATSDVQQYLMIVVMMEMIQVIHMTELVIAQVKFKND